MPKSVLVIGGGVAGIAAALPLAEAGFRVELYEKRPLLGGRASSIIDKETGERIDVCQHGTMRCCVALSDLFRRLGVEERIDWRRTIRFLDADGKRSSIAPCGLPAPLHTSFSFLTFRSLQLRDKLAIGRGMISMLRSKGDDDRDIASWMVETGQTERAVTRFWAPILIGACNETLHNVSRAHAFKIFLDGFLLNAHAYEFGVPKAPLADLYTEPTIAALAKRGGCVHLRDHIDAMTASNGAIASARLVDSSEVNADYFVSAVPFDLLLKLLPTSLTNGVPYFENLRSLSFSPIVGVHLWFDRPIDCPDALALLDRTSHWIFNKTRNFGLDSERGTYLSVVISADRGLVAMERDEIARRVLADVHAALPQTRTATLTRSLVLKERKATFSPRPGVERLRPDQRSPIPNLFVAGEWTATGWPSTMESAARSGYLAAEKLLEREGVSARLVPNDAPVGRLAKLVRGRRSR